jgi:hypothetical protein
MRSKNKNGTKRLKPCMNYVAPTEPGKLPIAAYYKHVAPTELKKIIVDAYNTANSRTQDDADERDSMDFFLIE